MTLLHLWERGGCAPSGSTTACMERRNIIIIIIICTVRNLRKKTIHSYCHSIRHQPIMLIFPPIMLCCSAQNFDLLCSCKNDLCLKSDCSIRVYSLVSYVECFITVYPVLHRNNKYGECFIRVYRSLLIFFAKHFLLCWHYA